MFGGISRRTLTADTSTEVSMNSCHVVTALAAMRRRELIAQARRARLLREIRLAARRSRYVRCHSAAPIPKPSGNKLTAGLVERPSLDNRPVSARPAERACLIGDRR